MQRLLEIKKHLLNTNKTLRDEGQQLDMTNELSGGIVFTACLRGACTAPACLILLLLLRPYPPLESAWLGAET